MRSGEVPMLLGQRVKISALARDLSIARDFGDCRVNKF